MSALDETPANGLKGITHWRQPVPTPAYLGIIKYSILHHFILHFILHYFINFFILIF